MAKLIATIVAILVFQVTGASSAWAEARIATLVGNSAYLPGLELPNPVADVRLLERRLKSLGFDVRVYTDVDSRSLGVLIQEHGNRLSSAGKNAVGFFIYSGHAVQIDGENFLLGVDYRGGGGGYGSAPLASVSANLISEIIGDAGNRINFIILDACRDDPTGRGGAGRGLARMDAPRGAMLAYSTSPGQRALDGQGANSPYAQALDAALSESGLTAEQVFRRTRDRVAALTAGMQTPWESSSLLGDDFYFSGSKADPAEAARRRIEDEKALWGAVADSGDATMIQTYLASYPDGSYANIARRKVKEITQKEDEYRKLRLLGEPGRAGISIQGQPSPTQAQSGSSLFTMEGSRLVGKDKNLGVNLGVVLEAVRDGGPFRVRVREVSDTSPFFGKLAIGDEITRINRQPIAEASVAYALEDAFNLQRRVDLIVKRGATPYVFSYVEPKKMGN